MPSWALAAFAGAVALGIRLYYGYFLAANRASRSCRAVRNQVLEARVRRDGTLIVCLAAFLLITPFVTSQSLLALAAALPASCCWAARSTRSSARRDWRHATCAGALRSCAPQRSCSKGCQSRRSCS